MNIRAHTEEPILPSFVVHEEGVRKMLVYINIPELKVKRSLKNCFKLIPLNGHEKEVDFRNQSFTFTINIQGKLYSMSITRLPGIIKPKSCSIKYQRAGCWIKLIKLKPISWMDQICNDLKPGLDITSIDMNF